ncbi:hypothetical protein F4778DRAFT_780979 [Xylariomycetidae sp. FL2044]|nr:hypothetical protein F4778DRAFT_780979 [Xylariomycetidae sp. FL2044]
MTIATHSVLGALALGPLASAAVFGLPIIVRNTVPGREVNVRTPAVSHTLMFDTGSSTPWYVDPECAESCDNFSGGSQVVPRRIRSERVVDRLQPGNLRRDRVPGGVFGTGAGQITVPPGQVEAMYESIGMNFTAILRGDHIPLCTDFNATWSVSFAFGDDAADPRVVIVTGEQLARPGFATRDDACWPPFDKGDTEGFFLFGTPLLEQFYTIWDFGSELESQYDPRVGFGQLKEEYRP